jgi:hypothetical protein
MATAWLPRDQPAARIKMAIANLVGALPPTKSRTPSLAGATGHPLADMSGRHRIPATVGRHHLAFGTIRALTALCASVVLAAVVVSIPMPPGVTLSVVATIGAAYIIIRR